MNFKICRASGKSILTWISLVVLVSLFGNGKPAFAKLIVTPKNPIIKDLELGSIVDGIPTPPKDRLLKSGQVYLWGLAESPIDGKWEYKPNIIDFRCGCDDTKFKKQFRVNGAEFTGEIIFSPTISLSPQLEFTLADGNKATFDRDGLNNNSGIMKHENKHVDLSLKFVKLLVAGVNSWAKNYIGAWFIDPKEMNEKFIKDMDNATTRMFDEYYPKLDAWETDSGHDKYDYMKLNEYLVDNKPYFSVDDNGDWEKLVSKKIDDFGGYEKYDKYDKDDAKIPCVPGPLPILGVGIFFRYTRKLRRRSKYLNSQAPLSIRAWRPAPI